MIRRWLLACGVVLLATTAYGEAAKRVSMRVRAVDGNGKVVGEKIALSGTTLRLTANVPQAAENRFLATGIECTSGFFRSWQEQLNGDQAPYSRESNVGPMPAGWCEVGVLLAYIDPKAKDGISYYRASGEMCFIGGDITCQ